MYPTEPEKAVIDAAERIMIDTMARYDPSHDAYHGTLDRITISCSAPDHAFNTVLFSQFNASGKLL